MAIEIHQHPHQLWQSAAIGFAFPDGSREKRSKCQRVMDTNGVMTTQFENFDGECERKRL